LGGRDRLSAHGDGRDDRSYDHDESQAARERVGPGLLIGPARSPSPHTHRRHARCVPDAAHTRTIYAWAHAPHPPCMHERMHSRTHYDGYIAHACTHGRSRKRSIGTRTPITRSDLRYVLTLSCAHVQFRTPLGDSEGPGESPVLSAPAGGYEPPRMSAPAGAKPMPFSVSAS
jgi:hypothetical protein